MKPKVLLLLLFLLFRLSSSGVAIPLILLNENTLGKSICNQSVFLEDANKEYSIERILTDSSLQFNTAKNGTENLNFTKSGFWFRFKVRNELPKDISFLIETARPVTNKVLLYQVYGTNVIRKWESGDNIPYERRAINHRKILFPIQLNDNNEREYVIYIESDGEVVTMPLIFWKPQQFMEYDYKFQLLNGIFYGVLLFVAIIYFFFYIALKESSFLYYVIYVLFMASLQFSLDGMSYQFLFPNSPYWADHFVLFSAGGGVLFVLLFGNSFLKLWDTAPRIFKIYKVIIPIIAAIIAFSIFPGPLYHLAYPLVNAGTLISLLLTLYTIFYLKLSGQKVDWFFMTAFTFLIVSVFFFIMGQFNFIENREFTEGILKAGSGMEVIFLSLSLAGQYRELQESKEQAQKELLVQLEEKNQFAAEINIRLEKQVKERTHEIEMQKETLEEKNKEILDSINYAKRIQYAILPPDDLVKETLPDSFILYRPKDIVSGDFYFVYPVTTSENPPRKLSLFAAVDCTGHGVPGAFMSILGNNILKATLTEKEVNSPADALNYLNRNIISSLSQSKQDVAIRDGMDIALCALESSSGTLHYAGANNPVWVVSKRSGAVECIELNPDKQPIGNYGNNSPFTNHSMKVEKGDMIYVFTDGYADQFGGPKGKKFKYSQLKELLLSIYSLPCPKQREILEQTFTSWKGNLEQLDDVCLIGVRV